MSCVAGRSGFLTLAAWLAPALLCAPGITGSAGGQDAARHSESEASAVIGLGRGALDWVLEMPVALLPWRLNSILPADAFGRMPQAEDLDRAWGEVFRPLGLDALVGGGLESLGDLVARSKWSVVQPTFRDDVPVITDTAPMHARMSVALPEAIPLEARLGIETDGIREEYFVFSTELGLAARAAALSRLKWNARLDYRTSVESPASAMAEQRVGLRLTARDMIGVSGRLEDRNLDVQESPLVDLAPAGEVYWNHQWFAGLDSSLKMRQSLPDLQSLWLNESGSGAQFEAAIRASFDRGVRVDLQGSSTPDLLKYGVRLQLEFMLGSAPAVAPQRLAPLGPPGDDPSRDEPADPPASLYLILPR